MLGTEPQIFETYVKTGQVVVVFAPVLNHGWYSEQAHQAAECAADQDYFWPYHHLLFENQDALWGDPVGTAKRLALEAGLDAARFNACLDNQTHYDLIYEQDRFRQTRGIRGQPVLDINGDIFYGAQPFEVLQKTIEAKLAEAAGGATPEPAVN